MRLPPQRSSTQQSPWATSSAGISAASGVPSQSSVAAPAPSSWSTPQTSTLPRSSTPQRSSPAAQAPNTPSLANTRSLTPSRTWNVKNGPTFPRDPFHNAVQQQTPSSPARSVSSDLSNNDNSPTKQRITSIVQQKQPPPQQRHSNPAIPGPSTTDYFRNRVKRQPPNGSTAQKLAMEPEPETTISATSNPSSSSSNIGIIPSSFPRTAPANAKNKNSNSASASDSFTPTTSSFKAARGAFAQSNTNSSSNATSTEPEPQAIQPRQEPEPPAFLRRHTYVSNVKSSLTYNNNNDKNNNDIKHAAVAVVKTLPTAEVNRDIKPQLSSAMKHVDTYYKKFLAQEMDEVEVASHSSTIMTNTDVRDELLERLQHEYVAHTQQITVLQQQLQEETLEKKMTELHCNTEKQQLQSNLNTLQRQLEEQRSGNEQRVTKLERACQAMQKELEAKRWLEERRPEEEHRVSELENMCDMLQKDLEEEKHQKAKLQSQFNDDAEEKCREYFELELAYQTLQRQLLEQQEAHRKEMDHFFKKQPQSTNLEAQVLTLQQLLKEEKDSSKLAERKLKKQAEEKYHELLMTCNTLRTQNDELQKDYLQKEEELMVTATKSQQENKLLQEQVLELKQNSEAWSVPTASGDRERNLTVEVRRLQNDLQLMTERLELCREPQAVGDIKTKFESVIFGLEQEKEEYDQRLQTLEHTNSKLKMMIQNEAYAIGVEMVKLLNEDGETAGIMELEAEFSRAHSEHKAIQEAMPDVTKTKPSNLTPDGQAKVNPEKLAKMKQQLIELRVANARFEKQIAFVKGICDQVVESLRQELNDVESEKANFEKEMLSQLTAIAAAKAAVEDDLTAKLDVSEQTVKSLKRKLMMGDDSSSRASRTGDLTESLDKLTATEKEKAELQQTAQEQEKKIHDLYEKLDKLKKNPPLNALKVAKVPRQHEEEMAKLENDIKVLLEKLEGSDAKVSELRQTASEQKQIIATLSADLKMAERSGRSGKGKSTKEDGEEIVEYLARVSFIYDQTSSSMEILDGMLKQLKALEAMDENDSKYPNALRQDRQEVMSLLSRSKQVREEMKISLQLIELNLMNQLESIRNESQMTTSFSKPSSTKRFILEARDVAASFEQKSMQIREEARQSLHHTEQELLSKIASFEAEVKKNEVAANRLKRTCAEQEQALKDARTKQKLTCSGASKALLNTLNKEVHTTVDKMREKEEEVRKLNSELDELRRELDEVIREKDERIEALETQTKHAEEKMKILKGSFSFSDDEMSNAAEQMKPSPFFMPNSTGYKEGIVYQDSPDMGYF